MSHSHGGLGLKLVLDRIIMKRGSWSCAADGILVPGIHLITGRVGSGKTTLAELICGLLEPTSGELVLDGISSWMLCQQFPEYHVIGATLEKEAQSYGVVPELALDRAGLTGRGGEDPFCLSRGELRKLQFSCLSLCDRDLFVWDEPYSALDCRQKQRVAQHLSTRSSGITILFTHEQRYFPKTDYLWEMCDGVLKYVGKVPEALPWWEHAPSHIRFLIGKGVIPANLTEEDLGEALCRMQG